MQKIKEQFKKVIEYSQEFAPNVENIFNNWKANKAWFIKKFNGLIYEYPEIVHFRLDEKAKDDQIKALEEYLIAEGYYDLSRFIIIEKEGFFDNKVVEEYTLSDGIIIPKGIKLLKAFKYFIKDNPAKLNEFQMKASNIIQENKISGKLCLSVHPLDYLSSSENTYHWRSCHALDGSYRAGNLSYMADNSTIICYLKSEEDAKLPHFPEDVPWNNKKWRMLIHMNQEHSLMFAGRQYPFQTTAVLDILHKICEDVFNYCNWTKWNNHYYSEDCLGDLPIHFHKRYIPLHHPQAIEDIVVDCGTSKLHYNDVLYSRYYPYPYYSCAYDKTVYGDCLAIKNSTVEVGHNVYCLHCGKYLIEPNSDTMMCFSCELDYGKMVNNTFGFCDCCGERILLDDATYLEYNNKIYCATCVGKQLIRCNFCDDLLDKNDAVQDDDGNYYCADCWDDKNEEDIEH